ncbi:MAG: class I SAM-dependent methyltransferase [Vicinamibacteria bacterium]|nr:class I SAM-dependent methyltransferase [Vicinamibacteria bacterium]
MTVEDELLPTKDGYDRWAEIYDEEVNPLVMIEEPEVAAALGDVNGLAILDVGCGTGRHAVRLASAGARVTGLDFSSGMLEKARAKPGADRVHFVHQDASGILPFEDRSFDRVISCLVVDHVRDLAAFFGELHRVCRDDGFIVVSVMHPAMMLKGVQARFHDPRTGARVFPQSVPNQISDYVMGALEAGLRIRHLSEHAVGGDLVARAPRAEKYLGWPMLFLMTATPAVR